MHGVFDKYLRYQMLSLTHRGKIAAEEHQAFAMPHLARREKAEKILRVHIAAGVDHSLAAKALKGLNAA